MLFILAMFQALLIYWTLRNSSALQFVSCKFFLMTHCNLQSNQIVSNAGVNFPVVPFLKTALTSIYKEKQNMIYIYNDTIYINVDKWFNEFDLILLLLNSHSSVVIHTRRLIHPHQKWCTNFYTLYVDLICLWKCKILVYSMFQNMHSLVLIDKEITRKQYFITCKLVFISLYGM